MSLRSDLIGRLMHENVEIKCGANLVGSSMGCGKNYGLKIFFIEGWSKVEGEEGMKNLALICRQCNSDRLKKGRNSFFEKVERADNEQDRYKYMKEKHKYLVDSGKIRRFE